MNSAVLLAFSLRCTLLAACLPHVPVTELVPHSALTTGLKPVQESGARPGEQHEATLCSVLF